MQSASQQSGKVDVPSSGQSYPTTACSHIPGASNSTNSTYGVTTCAATSGESSMRKVDFAFLDADESSLGQGQAVANSSHNPLVDSSERVVSDKQLTSRVEIRERIVKTDKVYIRSKVTALVNSLSVLRARAAESTPVFYSYCDSFLVSPLCTVKAAIDEDGYFGPLVTVGVLASILFSQ
eukprot:GILI01027413.1.p1 GENE.GILI01027413.1~~GILI01027413.1.p1  ORF type:complete len:180 (-),score=15.41 GILI01027413.1:104-643(-)